MTTTFETRAKRLLPRGQELERHDRAVFDLRLRRDAAVKEVPDFEALTEHAARIKDHTLDHLATYLERFEAQAEAAGAQVHWAIDAEEHNRIVYEILRERAARHVVKSKSMLTEECGLNGYLESRGIEIIDTDLGERIVQLGRELPSHIVVPAVHRSREQIGALFHRHMGTPQGEDDPIRLTEYARQDLRPRFLAADAGITGVNFAIAENGTLVVCTNEGNADLGMSLPSLHIACMGIDKLLPTLDDLAPMLRLLARSATGQPITAYTSMVRGPAPGGALHIVVVDNGRTRLLADPDHRRSLACIRCGACLNTCPVYRRAGGHAYGLPVAGPIGAALAPALSPQPPYDELPLASTLCGSCSAVCPVRIDLHSQLLDWRHKHSVSNGAGRRSVRWAAALMARPRLFRLAGRIARLLWPLARRTWPGNPAAPWLEARELPEHPGASFASRYRRGGRSRS